MYGKNSNYLLIDFKNKDNSRKNFKKFSQKKYMLNLITLVSLKLYIINLWPHLYYE